STIASISVSSSWSRILIESARKARENDVMDGSGGAVSRHGSGSSRRHQSRGGVDDPAVFEQVVDGDLHRFPDREPWPPTLRLDLPGIEIDERIVPDPAAVPTGVLELRFGAQSLRNPSRR